MTTVTRVGSSLTHIPVRHTCGHFEVRLTRWNGLALSTILHADPPNADGFLKAGSPCSQCSPQGRPPQVHFDTLERAQAFALVSNAGQAK